MYARLSRSSFTNAEEVIIFLRACENFRIFFFKKNVACIRILSTVTNTIIIYTWADITSNVLPDIRVGFTALVFSPSL